METMRFEQLLVHKLGLTPATVEQARQRQTARGGSLRENLIALNVFTEATFAERISAQLRVPYHNVKQAAIADEVLALLPREKAEKYLALPLELNARHRRLTITMANPFNMSAIDELKFVIGYTLILHYTPDDELAEALQREYARFEAKQLVVAAEAAPSAPPADAQSAVIDLAALATADTPVAQLLGAMLLLAHAKQASEMSLETAVDGLRLCFRMEGKIAEIARFPRKVTPLLLSRLKRALGCEGGERTRLCQKGHATVKLKNKKELELAYQIYPTAQSENVLLKFKDRTSLPGLEDFALEPKARQDLQQAVEARQGLVLVSGVAKSGLTTTLYALLKMANAAHKQVLAIEDPIECHVEGVSQGQIQEDAGQTYEQYLQYAAKQRPEVVLLDKIVDGALLQNVLLLASGALVLSSVAAVDAASAALKLLLLSPSPLVIDRLNCITSLRLVRKICEHCKEPVTLAEAYREKLGLTPVDRCYAGKGCEHCGQTGYKGNVALFEVLPLTADLKNALLAAAPLNDVRNLSASQHVLSLRDDGMRRVKQGVTTVQEVLKATIL